MADQNPTDPNGTTNHQPSQALTPYQNRAIQLRENIGSGEARALVPTTFAEAQSFAGALANSDLVPFKLRQKAPDILMMILAGAELQIPPVRSLTLFHPIEGVPKLSADGLAAICMRSSECELLEPKSQSSTTVTWIAKRRGRPEQSLTWTIEDAKAAGLHPGKPDRNGGPGNWIKYPRQMLNARCKAELCRLVWPELCAGLVSAEEAADMVPETEVAAARDVSKFSQMPPVAAVAPPERPAAPPLDAATSKATRAARAKAAPIDVVSSEVPAAPAAAAAEPAPVPPSAPATAPPTSARSVESPPPSETTSPPEPDAEPSRSTESESSSAPAAVADEGGFGDEDPPDSNGPGKLRTIELFAQEVAAARTPHEFNAIKLDWYEWSTGPGKPQARAMREIFAKAQAGR